nr:Hemagglutinin [Cowpox virus]
MTRLPILLLLISLVYATHTSKKIGDDATLSCSRNNTSDYVVMSAWYKEPNSIILLAAKSDVLYFDKYTKDKISYDSPYDDLVTTITIKSLTSEDAGTYVCAFFMTNDTTDKIDYEEYSTELIVNTDSESTIDIILSGSTHSPETISEKPEDIDNSNCSSAFEIATPEPITDNVEDHTDTVTYTSDIINTVSTSSGESTTDETPESITDNEEDHTVKYTVSTSSGIVTTKSTINDADLYDTYNDESSTVSPTTVESITKSIGKYSTKDYVEVFGIAALIILSAVAVFCITYYICNKRSRKYKTENKV